VIPIHGLDIPDLFDQILISKSGPQLVLQGCPEVLNPDERVIQLTEEKGEFFCNPQFQFGMFPASISVEAQRCHGTADGDQALLGILQLVIEWFIGLFDQVRHSKQSQLAGLRLQNQLLHFPARLENPPDMGWITLLMDNCGYIRLSGLFPDALNFRGSQSVGRVTHDILLDKSCEKLVGGVEPPAVHPASFKAQASYTTSCSPCKESRPPRASPALSLWVPGPRLRGAVHVSWPTNHTGVRSDLCYFITRLSIFFGHRRLIF
jgi:hypothetical protein